jgi:hypothetical protein|tara:strand:- start:2311 stop:3438 length:1128 start_codon:yes stop_codon:yes gene_type:complete
MRTLQNIVILIISPEAWGINRISKHHYAVELSNRDNKVYFLNPPEIDSREYQIEHISNNRNLYIIKSPQLIRGLNHIPFNIRKYFHRMLAKQILREIVHRVDVVWSFDPYRFQFMRAFGARFNIYHAVDVHKNKVELDIVNNADLLLASSDRILDKFKAIDMPKFKINHGLAEYFINGKNNDVSFIEHPEKINVGYVGNLHYHFLDVDILREIIVWNPDIDFYFIGPYEKSNLSQRINNYDFIEFLKSRINVYLLGSVPSWQLPGYLSQCDLFLMCYSGDRNIAEMANPHKILEYLSTGKVVVCHYIDEYRSMRDIIELVDNNKLLPSTFHRVVENLNHYNSQHKSNRRIWYARANTYAKQIERIESIINDLSIS